MDSNIETPPGIAAVLRELDSIHAAIRDNRDAVQREVSETRAYFEERFHDVGDKLDDIVLEARKTNGRLRRAELWIAGLKAVGAAIALSIPFLVALFTHNL